MGRDRCDQQVALRWRQDGPARAERVAGTAGGRRDDDAIAAVDREARPIDADIDVDGPAGKAAADDDVVQAVEVVRDGPIIHDVATEHEAFFRAPIAGDNLFEPRKEVARAEVCEEAEAAHVHTEQWGPAGHDEAARPQHRPIAADADNQSGSVQGGLRRPRPRRRRRSPRSRAARVRGQVAARTRRHLHCGAREAPRPVPASASPSGRCPHVHQKLRIAISATDGRRDHATNFPSCAAAPGAKPFDD